MEGEVSRVKWHRTVLMNTSRHTFILIDTCMLMFIFSYFYLHAHRVVTYSLDTRVMAHVQHLQYARATLHSFHA